MYSLTLPGSSFLVFISSAAIVALFQVVSPETSVSPILGPIEKLSLIGVLFYACKVLYMDRKSASAELDKVRADHVMAITKLMQEHAKATAEQALASMQVMTLVLEAVKEARKANEDTATVLEQLETQVSDIPCNSKPKGLVSATLSHP